MADEIYCEECKSKYPDFNHLGLPDVYCKTCSLRFLTHLQVGVEMNERHIHPYSTLVKEELGYIWDVASSKFVKPDLQKQYEDILLTLVKIEDKIDGHIKKEL